MNKILVMAIVSIISFSSCAHLNMRGSVVVKESAGKAHVCLGEDEVKISDSVRLFYRNCTPTGRGYECIKEAIGEGSVILTLGKHYSVVKVDPGVSSQEGTIVEKE